MWNWQTREQMKKNFICSKKSVRTFKLRIEPSFLIHGERGESLQNQDFVGGMQKRRRFAASPLGFRKPISDFCGEREIRTPETVSRLPPFQGGAFDHSAISPYALCYSRKALWRHAYWLPSSLLILSWTGGWVEKRRSIQPAEPPSLPKGLPMKR